MGMTLQRFLIFLSVLGAIYLGASLLNHIWPVDPAQPLRRMLIGDAVFGSKFLLTVFAYLLMRLAKIKAALLVVAIWIIFSVFYAFSVLLFEPISAFSMGIFSGEVFICGLLAYYSIAEARSHGLFANAKE